ncbi:hypothetical protein PHACT_08475 [Pseudohongiella acticola]|uniref:Uncharacterized protein n=1 Tax=Pseudohongiella acticola TaxID=1524254 RepID=A0A1E8CLJ3_9GAMM|nr:hypothetical protein [Pseudohongiella acticola]OFE13172.1 hypothetical protein PHACT_08475 [Pseudohongiella acticola]
MNSPVTQNRHDTPISSISLILAIIAFVPSAATFTPAIFLSAFALAGAVIGMVAGAVRRGILTILAVCGTVVVSPLSPTEAWFSSVSVEAWILGMSTAWLAVAGVFLLHYLLKRNS